MNSILQILYYIRPLRKTVVDYAGESKTMLTLREVFLNLTEGVFTKHGAVDGQDLIEAYGRFSDFPRRQQDTH